MVFADAYHQLLEYPLALPLPEKTDPWLMILNAGGVKSLPQYMATRPRTLAAWKITYQARAVICATLTGKVGETYNIGGSQTEDKSPTLCSSRAAGKELA